MIHYFKTLNARLLSTYFVFIGLIVVMLFFCWNIFAEYSQNKDFQDDLNRLLIAQLRMYKSEKDFLNDEIKDSTFYIEGQSKCLENIKKESQFFNQMLSKMQTLELVKNANLDVDFMELKLNINAYSRNFEKIVELSKIKGFKDFGLEGNLRKNIHQIEKDFPVFDKIDLLTLRKIEKDFIIRKDAKYIELMQAKKNEISRKYAKANSGLKTMLDSYFSAFFQFAEIDLKLGVSESEGFKAQNEAYFLKTTQNLTTIGAKTQDFINQHSKNLGLKLVFLLLFSVFIALLLAFYIAKSITKPISELVDFMHNEKEYNMEDLPKFKHKTTIQELSVIQNEYLKMYASICANMSDIKIRNIDLRNLNALISDTNNELKQRELYLQSSNKLRDVFISIISHDIKSPLNTLKGFLDILIDYPNVISEDEKITNIRKIRENTVLQINLLTNLLGWTRTQSEDMKIVVSTFNAAELVNQTTELLLPTATNKNIKILNKVRHIELNTDKNILDLVFRNLISNAIKFSYHGGKITIDSTVLDSKILYSIIDNGVGIEKEVLAKINNGQEQFSTKGTSNELGTGFGLLFCRSFIEKIGGELKIYSTKGVGTTIYFSIPMALNTEETQNDKQNLCEELEQELVAVYK